MCSDVQIFILYRVDRSRLGDTIALTDTTGVHSKTIAIPLPL